MTRFKMVVSAHLFLFRDNQVLLARRFNTGYEDGKFSLPAGHVDGNETITQAALREAREEAGVIVKPEHLEFLHVMHRIHDRESIDFFFGCRQWQGEPQICEPDKCDMVKWFEVTELPPNTIPYIKEALDMALNKQVFSQLTK